MDGPPCSVGIPCFTHLAQNKISTWNWLRTVCDNTERSLTGMTWLPYVRLTFFSWVAIVIEVLWNSNDEAVLQLYSLCFQSCWFKDSAKEWKLTSQNHYSLHSKMFSLYLLRVVHKWTQKFPSQGMFVPTERQAWL